MEKIIQIQTNSYGDDESFFALTECGKIYEMTRKGTINNDTGEWDTKYIWHKIGLPE